MDASDNDVASQNPSPSSSLELDSYLNTLIKDISDDECDSIIYSQQITRNEDKQPTVICTPSSGKQKGLLQFDDLSEDKSTHLFYRNRGNSEDDLKIDDRTVVEELNSRRTNSCSQNAVMKCDTITERSRHAQVVLQSAEKTKITDVQEVRNTRKHSYPFIGTVLDNDFYPSNSWPDDSSKLRKQKHESDSKQKKNNRACDFKSKLLKNEDNRTKSLEISLGGKESVPDVSCYNKEQQNVDVVSEALDGKMNWNTVINAAANVYEASLSQQSLFSRSQESLFDDYEAVTCVPDELVSVKNCTPSVTLSSTVPTSLDFTRATQSHASALSLCSKEKTSPREKTSDPSTVSTPLVTEQAISPVATMLPSKLPGQSRADCLSSVSYSQPHEFVHISACASQALIEACFQTAEGSHVDLLPVIDGARQAELPPMEGARHDNIPLMEGARHVDLPVMEGARHADLRLIEGARHADIPLMEGARHDDLPLIEGARHDDLPLMEGAGHDLPLMEGARHADLPLMEGARHDLPMIEGARHADLPLMEGARHDLPLMEGARHDLPLMEGARHADLPLMEGARHDLPLIEGARHDDIPLMEGDRHDDLPLIEGARHAELPLIEEARKADLPLIEGARHADLHLIEEARKADLPLIEGARHDLPLMEKARHADLPLMEKARNADLPLMEGARHAELPLIEGARHADLPLMEGARYADLPLMEGARHNNLPLIEEVRPENLPLIKGARHDNLPLIEETRHDNLPLIEGARHDNLPLTEEARHAELYVIKAERQADLSLTEEAELPLIEETGHTELPLTEEARQTEQPQIKETRQSGLPLIEKARQVGQSRTDKTRHSELPLIEETRKTERLLMKATIHTELMETEEARHTQLLPTSERLNSVCSAQCESQDIVHSTSEKEPFIPYELQNERRHKITVTQKREQTVNSQYAETSCRGIQLKQKKNVPGSPHALDSSHSVTTVPQSSDTAGSSECLRQDETFFDVTQIINRHKRSSNENVLEGMSALKKLSAVDASSEYVISTCFRGSTKCQQYQSKNILSDNIRTFDCRYQEMPRSPPVLISMEGIPYLLPSSDHIVPQCEVTFAEALAHGTAGERGITQVTGDDVGINKRVTDGDDVDSKTGFSVCGVGGNTRVTDDVLDIETGVSNCGMDGIAGGNDGMVDINTGVTNGRLCNSIGVTDCDVDNETASNDSAVGNSTGVTDGHDTCKDSKQTVLPSVQELHSTVSITESADNNEDLCNHKTTSSCKSCHQDSSIRISLQILPDPRESDETTTGSSVNNDALLLYSSEHQAHSHHSEQVSLIPCLEHSAACEEQKVPGAEPGEDLSLNEMSMYSNPATEEHDGMKCKKQTKLVFQWNSMYDTAMNKSLTDPPSDSTLDSLSAIVPIAHSHRPLRIGLSRKQKVKRLHNKQ